MTNYRVKNWHKFQHFKDRRPPWIKLYRDLLDDREWHNLDPAAAKCLVMIWLIASEDDGNLPAAPDLAFRLRMNEKQFLPLLHKLTHWLEQSDNNVISPCHQHATPETETETETETEGELGRANAPKTKLARGSRLNANWTLPSEWGRWAESQGMSRDAILREEEKFKDYWISKSGTSATKTDWQATWRNWIRKHLEEYAK